MNHDRIFSILDDTSDVSMFLEEELEPIAAEVEAETKPKPDFSSDTLPQPLRDETDKILEFLR